MLVIPYAGMLLAFLIGANRVQRGLHTGQETDSRIHALTNFIATLTYIRLGRSGWLCDRFLDRDRVLSPALPAYALLLLLLLFLIFSVNILLSSDIVSYTELACSSVG